MKTEPASAIGIYHYIIEWSGGGGASWTSCWTSWWTSTMTNSATHLGKHLLWREQNREQTKRKSTKTTMSTTLTTSTTSTSISSGTSMSLSPATFQFCTFIGERERGNHFIFKSTAIHRRQCNAISRRDVAISRRSGGRGATDYQNDWLLFFEWAAPALPFMAFSKEINQTPLIDSRRRRHSSGFGQRRFPLGRCSQPPKWSTRIATLHCIS